MPTNPILARREIPGSERLQKALVMLAVTVAAVAAGWFLTDASVESDPAHLAGIVSVALAGLVATAWFGLKKYESGADKEKSRAIRDRIHDDRQGRSWVTRIGYNTKRLFGGTVVLAGILVALGGIGVLGFQSYGFLRTGDWPAMSLLRLAYPHIEWLRDPQSWYGLHKIAYDFLHIVPASIALIILGWLVAGFGSALKGRVRR